MPRRRRSSASGQRLMDAIAPTAFNYEVIEESARDMARAAAERIRVRMRRTAQGRDRDRARSNPNKEAAGTRSKPPVPPARGWANWPTPRSLTVFQINGTFHSRSRPVLGVLETPPTDFAAFLSKSHVAPSTDAATRCVSQPRCLDDARKRTPPLPIGLAVNVRRATWLKRRDATLAQWWPPP